jgi:caffeoyl-CoA O-methyltransferase
MRDAVSSGIAADLPQNQVTATDGCILEVLLRWGRAKKVVEIGTLSGYSAQWIVRAIQPDGHLWTIEASPVAAAVSRGVFARAGLGHDTVTASEGPALSILPTIERHGPFDVVFVDADKDNYGRYAEWASRNLRPGGLLIGDNSYVFGWLAGVTPADETQEAYIRGMRAFHEVLVRDFDAACIPTTEGMMIGVKR